MGDEIAEIFDKLCNAEVFPFELVLLAGDDVGDNAWFASFRSCDWMLKIYNKYNYIKKHTRKNYLLWRFIISW